MVLQLQGQMLGTPSRLPPPPPPPRRPAAKALSAAAAPVKCELRSKHPPPPPPPAAEPLSLGIPASHVLVAEPIGPGVPASQVPGAGPIVPGVAVPRALGPKRKQDQGQGARQRRTKARQEHREVLEALGKVASASELFSSPNSAQPSAAALSVACRSVPDSKGDSAGGDPAKLPLNGQEGTLQHLPGSSAAHLWPACLAPVPCIGSILRDLLAGSQVPDGAEEAVPVACGQQRVQGKLLEHKQVSVASLSRQCSVLLLAGACLAPQAPCRTFRTRPCPHSQD